MTIYSIFFLNFLNLLISKLSFLYSNESGPIATVYYLKKIIFDKNHQLINSLNRPYSIVHQYDKRWGEFEVSVKEIKKNLNIK
jgi:hypothetical protein